jgi:hypothetical protein
MGPPDGRYRRDLAVGDGTVKVGNLPHLGRSPQLLNAFRNTSGQPLGALVGGGAEPVVAGAGGLDISSIDHRPDRIRRGRRGYPDGHHRIDQTDDRRCESRLRKLAHGVTWSA